MRVGRIGGIGFAAYSAYAASSVGAAGNAAGVDDTGAIGAGVAMTGLGSGQAAGSTDKAKAAAGTSDDTQVKPGYRSSPAECETCRTRKYKDGSDENVSFKSAQHISPNQAGAAVRAHEGEHVANAYKKAAEEGGRVISAGVSIELAVCPECGRSYVAGGLTRSVISHPSDEKNPYTQNAKGIINAVGSGAYADFKV